MKKISTVAIGIVTALAISAGSAYAWYVTTQTSQAVQVSTGQIDMDVSRLLTNHKLDNYLPGESIPLTSGTNGIENTGTRAVLVEVDFANVEYGTYGKLVTVNMADIPAALQADYDSTTMPGSIIMTQDRLFKCITIGTAASTSPNWVKVGEKYYTRMELNEKTDLGNIELKLEGELGGNKKDSSGNLSPDRKFEQGATFNIAFTARGCQVNEEAVTDLFGAEAVAAIKTAGHTNWLTFDAN